jgi:hypothetical protein
MRFLAAYAGVLLGIGSLVTTGCSESSGDDATGSAAKGGSGGGAGNAGGGTAGGGATGGAAGGGAAGGTSDIGIFGEANGQPFSLTEMVRCENLLPGTTQIEASFATSATSSQLMHITLASAIAPGNIDCEGGSSISYAPAYMEPATAEQYYMATQGIGSCAITITKVPTAIGDTFVGTFTASLDPQSGTGPSMTISNGRFRALLQ